MAGFFDESVMSNPSANRVEHAYFFAVRGGADETTPRDYWDYACTLGREL